MEFRAAYAQGFARVAAVTLPVTLAEPERNVDATLEQWRACDADSVALAVFPERTVAGPGGNVQMQSVPTGVVEAADGSLYVGELTGFPFPVGGANVYRIPAGGGAPTVVAKRPPKRSQTSHPARWALTCARRASLTSPSR